MTQPQPGTLPPLDHDGTIYGCTSDILNMLDLIPLGIPNRRKEFKMSDRKLKSLVARMQANTVAAEAAAASMNSRVPPIMSPTQVLADTAPPVMLFQTVIQAEVDKAQLKYMPKRPQKSVGATTNRQQRRRAARQMIKNNGGDAASTSEPNEAIGEEIKEVFDQMDFIYGELEDRVIISEILLEASIAHHRNTIRSKELQSLLIGNPILVDSAAFTYSNQYLSDLDVNLDYVYEQIGKWLVGYCGCLVQRDQVGQNKEILENLLDRLLGICYQLESWMELVETILKDGSTLCSPGELKKTDVAELKRREQRVKEVQSYLQRIQHRHAELVLTNDHRKYSELTDKDKDVMATRYARYMAAAFPAASTDHLSEIMGRVTLERIPSLLENP